MPLTLHVSDSNDKKVGNSTWVTTSESAKIKTRAHGQAQTRPSLSTNNIRLTTACTRTHARASTRYQQNAAGLRRHAYIRDYTQLDHTCHGQINTLYMTTYMHIVLLLHHVNLYISCAKTMPCKTVNLEASKFQCFHTVIQHSNS